MTRLPITRRTLLKGAGAAATLAAGRAPAFAADKLVPYANKSLDFYFFVAQEEAVKRAVEAKGWRFQAVNSSFDNTTQLQQWDSLLLNGPSAIISDPIDSQAIVSVIKKYNAKKFQSASSIRRRPEATSRSRSISTTTRAASWPRMRSSIA